MLQTKESLRLTFKFRGKHRHILHIQLVQPSIVWHQVLHTKNILFPYLSEAVAHLLSQLLCIWDHFTILKKKIFHYDPFNPPP